MTWKNYQIKYLLKFLIYFLIYKSNLITCTRSDIGAILYLQKYGYMNETSGFANLISENAFKETIRLFQRFAGLNETGNLDSETIEIMATPRCGNKDRDLNTSEDARRRRRYALQGSKWRRTDLTYRIIKYPKKLKRSVVDKEFARAFELWSNVTSLRFIHKKEGRVHIEISFAVGDHGDGDPFDGPGNTLAHAYFPQFGSNAHFDDEEHWSVNSYAGTNLFQVAAHELGHSLGLGHSSIRESLMAPFYQRFKPNFKLHRDDILGIQSLYGEPKNTPFYLPPTTTEYYPPSSTSTPLNLDEINQAENDLCQNGSIDAITRIISGRTFVFKGQYYWKIEAKGLADGYPRKISEDWGGLPGNLDSALTWSDGKTFFFKGDKYWKFFDMQMMRGYPKDIDFGFTGIPNNISASFVWSGNGKTYFFKGDQYWRFDSKSDPPVSSRYPKPIKNWVGLPNDIDDAFKWENGLTYFFKKTEYYRFNDADFEIDNKAKPPFPRPISVWWFDCKSNSRESSAYDFLKNLSNKTDKSDEPNSFDKFFNKFKKDLKSPSLLSTILQNKTALSSSSLTSSKLTIENDKEWIRLGHPDEEQPGIAAAYLAKRNSAFKKIYINRIILVANSILFVLYNLFYKF